jgi:NADPH-dependent F420 reductase
MTDKIGVLGTGRMGVGLAKLFARAGLQVNIGSRSAERALEAAAHILEDVRNSTVAGDDYEQTARTTHVVILAMPYREVDAVLRALEEELHDTVVVDITNPFGAAPEGMSGAEVHAPLLPRSASLVAAWKTNYFKYLDPDSRGGLIHDVFYCGEDEPSKRKVAELIAATGFRPIDCGGLESARALDAMVSMLGEIARRNNSESLFAWKFLP